MLSIVYRYSKCSSIITVYSGDDKLLYEIPSSSGVIKKYLGSKCARLQQAAKHRYYFEQDCY